MARVLVYGAGVIGSYLAHTLCVVGHDVDILARGKRKEELETKGLVLRHYLQGRTTVDRPRTIGALSSSERYDAVFAAMQYQQMGVILPALAAADSPLVCLVGNNSAAEEMERAIRAASAKPKAVVFAFQPTGGRREADRVVCVRFGRGNLTCGPARGELPLESARAMEALLPGKYLPRFEPDMRAWYACHLAFILPVAYLCYSLDCDLAKARSPQLSAVLDATREAYGLLRELGYPLHQGEEEYYAPGARRALLRAMLGLMAKTPLGRLAASDHCRSATEEMEALDSAFAALRARAPGVEMPAWEALRSSMPAWDALRERY